MTRHFGLALVAAAALGLVCATGGEAQARHHRCGGSAGDYGSHGGYGSAGGGGSFGGLFSRFRNGRGSHGSNGSHGGYGSNGGHGSHGGYGSYHKGTGHGDSYDPGQPPPAPEVAPQDGRDNI